MYNISDFKIIYLHFVVTFSSFSSTNNSEGKRCM